MFIVVVSATMFAFLGWSGLNPIGEVQSNVNFAYAMTTLLLVFVLRGSRERYALVMHTLLATSLMTCISLLIAVPHDESRVIWYYLLVVVSYILGGVAVGTLYTLLSIGLILLTGLFFDLHLSKIGINTTLFGLVILSMLVRLYRQKVSEYEEILTEQKKMLETFNSALEIEVAKKTAELRELNNSLEQKVKEKVSEVKAQEKMLIAQSRLAAMGEMLSMIAHQWRQPLATMSLMITNAQVKAMFDHRDSERDALLEEISHTLGYLSETIHDFQTYFEPQKHRETVVLNEILERVTQFTQSRFQMEHITLTAGGDTQLQIETYPSELVQIFMNLLNNAADAISERNPEKREVAIRCSGENGTVSIVIEDSGGGIDEEILPRIFEPYFSTKSKNGTGLGLYMAKMIIENHMGGTIAAQNGEKGAVFTLVLPKHIVISYNKQ
jgi:C4-dicarboxylate-specific signal transduction histidine kinase